MALLFSCIWTALESGRREPLGSYKSVPGPFLPKTLAVARSDTPSGQEQTPKLEQNHETVFSSPGRQACAGQGPEQALPAGPWVFFLSTDIL